MVKVSVIVPVYNTKEYLPKCINSLLDQTLDSLEIILVDDGSTDGSSKLLDEYSSQKGIKVFHIPNSGVSRARNFGISQAGGQYIGFVDSDDYIDRQMFAKLYNQAVKDDSDVVYCDSVNVFADGRQQYIKTENVAADDPVKTYIVSMPMAAVRLFKREIFTKISFCQDKIYEDFQLIGPTVANCHKFSYVKEGLYFYYQRSGSIMHQTTNNRHLLDIFDVLQSNYDYLYQDYPSEVEYLYISHLLRSGSLRFLDYPDGQQQLAMIDKIMKQRFSNFSANQYYKRSSLKMKLICQLAYHKQYFILKLIKKVTGR
ncbi:MAG: glycosyltransferase [Erysipelotrichaceae bacterium]